MHSYNEAFPQCFLHFFDIHFLKEIGNSKEIQKEAILATKLAFICSTTLIVPAASFFENDICNSIVTEITSTTGEHAVLLMSNTKNLESFIELKLIQYNKGSDQHNKYIHAIENKTSTHLESIKKQTSTTGQIKVAWDAKVKDGSLFQEFLSRRKILPEGFEELCKNIDTELNGLAYTPEHINDILFRNSPHKEILRTPIDSIVNAQYFSSYVRELPLCAVIVDMIKLHSTYVDDSKYPAHLPFKFFATELSREGLLDHINKSNFQALSYIRFDGKIIKSLQESTRRYYQLTNPTKANNMTSIVNNNSGITVNIVGNGNSTGDISDNRTIDWNTVQKEFELLKTQTRNDNEKLAEIAKAIQARDSSGLHKALKAAGFTAKFLLSIGASVIANQIGVL